LRSSLQSILIWLALAVLPTAAGAERVHLVGSFATIDLPDGFEESRQFTGVIMPEGHATILVTELPAAAFETLANDMLTSPEALAKKNIQLDSVNKIRQGEHKALLGRGRQTLEGQSVEKWILVIGAPQATLLITAQIPTLLARPDRVARMEAALASTRVAAARSVPRTDLPFTMGETERFRLQRALSANTVLLTEPAYTGPANQQPIFVIAASDATDCTDGKDNPHAFANRALAGLSRVRDLAITTTYDGPIGKDAGIITEATGVMADQKVIVVQTLRFSDCGYLRTIGIGPAADAAVYRGEFAALAAQVGWQAKPSAKPQ
jgi:hypothetical protein